MSRKNNKSQASTTNEQTTQEPVEKTSPAAVLATTEPTKTLSAAEQIAALKAQLKQLQEAAKSEVSEIQLARNAAKAELEASTKAWDELTAIFLQQPEIKAAYDRKLAAQAKVKELGGSRKAGTPGSGKAPGNHKGDPTQGKGLTAKAFAWLATVKTPHTVKEIFQGAKDMGWTPKEGAISDDAKSIAQLSSSLVQELKRPSPFVTRPESGKYQVA